MIISVDFVTVINVKILLPLHSAAKYDTCLRKDLGKLQNYRPTCMHE